LSIFAQNNKFLLSVLQSHNTLRSDRPQAKIFLIPLFLAKISVKANYKLVAQAGVKFGLQACI
jgi:hypothetical protein